MFTNDDYTLRISQDHGAIIDYPDGSGCFETGCAIFKLTPELLERYKATARARHEAQRAFNLDERSVEYIEEGLFWGGEVTATLTIADDAGEVRGELRLVSSSDGEVFPTPELSATRRAFIPITDGHREAIVDAIVASFRKAVSNAGYTTVELESSTASLKAYRLAA